MIGWLHPVAGATLRLLLLDLLAVPESGTVHVRSVLSWQGRSVSLLDESLLLATVNRSLSSATAT